MKVNFTVFPNKFKKSDNQPDYTSSMKVDEKWESIASCWEKTAKNGTKYLSCSVDTEMAQKSKEAYKEGNTEQVEDTFNI
jgi:uncharacterized protein (DUF736 family)